MDAREKLAALGAAVPEILLPRGGVNLSKWAVIACDQFTQDLGYWELVRRIAGDAPSALNLIYPEVYLERDALSGGTRRTRLTAIHRAMADYLGSAPGGGIFAPPLESLVYLERDTPCRQGRRGLLVCLDLERYDWKPGTAPLIRPTEGTVPERLPPRMDIRRGAPLEIPHILILINDPANTLFPALAERAKDPFRPGGGKPLYDAGLMLGSGRVRGWKLEGEADWALLAQGLERLAAGTHGDFLYAVGDGNHSLAASKGIWEEYKAARRKEGVAEGELLSHPARWVLVELENLYDPALIFEPIHRILFGAGAAELREVLSVLPGFRCRDLDAGGLKAALAGSAESGDPAGTDPPPVRFGLVSGESCFLIEADPAPLAVDPLQPPLDRFTRDHPGVRMDYIHGVEELFRLAGPGGGQSAAGIALPPFRKQGLFTAVAKRGVLPRKSFSMGEAVEKRFYLECRRLFG
ncbi:MAG: DUF1015 domain-containing protein [Treponema sp.]|nr:DUF1015 domain-containing protein [Treponema sp.]